MLNYVILAPLHSYILIVPSNAPTAKYLAFVSFAPKATPYTNDLIFLSSLKFIIAFLLSSI